MAGLACSAALLAPVPAHALTIDPSVSQGAQVPPLPAGPPASFGGLDASPDYVGYSYGTADEYAAPTGQIRSLADGSLVRSVPVADANDAPAVTGDDLIQTTTDDQTGDVTITATDIASGSTAYTLSVPGGQSLAYAGPLGVLATVPDGAGYDVILYRPGLDPVAVPGVVLGSAAGSSGFGIDGSDGVTVLVNDGGNIWQLHLINDTGAEVLPGPAGTTSVLTPHKVYFVEPAGSSTTIAWQNRDSSAPGSLQLPETTSVLGRALPLGDRIAFERNVNGTAEIDPLDLATTVLDPAVATHVLQATPVGDGRLALALADTATGRIALVADDGQPPATVTALPAVGMPVASTFLSGSVVAADFGATGTSGPVEVTSLSSPGSWSMRSGAGPAGVHGLAGVSGDEVLAGVASGAGNVQTYRLSWTGGHRDMTTVANDISLSRGGKYVARVASLATGSTLRIEDARTGTARAAVAVTASWAIDGTTLWTGPSSTGVLTATDLTGATPVRRVSTGLACTAGGLQVAGRWALAKCGATWWVLDTAGTYARWAVPITTGDSDLQLGAGFVAWLHQVPGATPDQDYDVVHVATVAGGHATRQYGPVHALYSPPAPDFAVDESSAAHLVYLDSTRQIRFVDLTTLVRLNQSPLPGGIGRPTPPPGAYLPRH